MKFKTFENMRHFNYKWFNGFINIFNGLIKADKSDLL